MNPELFHRVGITPPKGCLLYGPPGTGKTLLARAVAKQLDANFLKVVSSAIVDKYIGESARLIREMFGKKLNFVVYILYTVLNLIQRMEKSNNFNVEKCMFFCQSPHIYVNIMRIRKMLISCVELDHALYLINYGS